MSPAIFRDESTIVSFQSPNRARDPGMLQLQEADDADSPFDLQEFNIRMANSQGRREAATMLLKKMYSWRGYSVEAPPAAQPNAITLTADTAGKTVGTMTLCFDGEDGLPADATFKAELDSLRAQSRRLCEPSRLAIDKDTPKRVFAALMHISYIYSHKMHLYTDYVIEVNPRHAVFYKRMLGFHDFGPERMCARVDAPAVLLRLECQHMADQINKFGGLFENATKERSFYPFFFSSRDEIGIHHRLKTGQR
jgi:hypothetical protein